MNDDASLLLLKTWMPYTETVPGRSLLSLRPNRIHEIPECQDLSVKMQTEILVSGLMANLGITAPSISNDLHVLVLPASRREIGRHGT